MRTVLYLIAIPLLLAFIGAGVTWSLAIRPWLAIGAVEASDWRQLPQVACQVVSAERRYALTPDMDDYLRIGCAGSPGPDDLIDNALPLPLAQGIDAATLVGATVNLRRVDEAYGRIGASSNSERWLVAVERDGAMLVDADEAQAFYADKLRPTIGGTIWYALIGLGCLFGAALIGRWIWRLGSPPPPPSPA